MGVIKNDVGRPSNKTIMIRRILKLILALIIVGLAVALGYFIKSKEESNTNRKEVLEEEVVNLSVKDEEVNKLFNSMNNELNSTLSMLDSQCKIDYWSYFYSFDHLNSKDIDDKIKLAYSVDSILTKEFGEDYYDSQEIFKYKLEVNEVNLVSKKIFGSGLEDFNIDMSVSGRRLIYNKDSDSYNFESAEIGDSGGATIITKIMDAKKYYNKIEIINKVMFVASYTDETKLFKTAELDDFEALKKKHGYDINEYYTFGLTNELDSFDNSNEKEYDETLKNIKIDDYLDKLDSFKWTFVKNKDGNYVFSSVEKVK